MNYVVYNPTTGDVLRAGDAPANMIELQAQGVDEAVIAVPPGVIAWPALNLDPLKLHLANQIDAAAEAARSLFLTPGSGQALTYQRKENEARDFLVNADPLKCPFLVAEAAATDISLEDLVDIVIAKADEWVMVGTAIEPIRMGAKKNMLAATHIAELVAAASVTWPSSL